MTLVHWASVAAFLGMSVPTAALQASPQPQAANTPAATPAMTYNSAFASYRPFKDADAPPDTAWRAANAVVQSQSGHGSHGNSASQSAPSVPDSAGQRPAGQMPATSRPSQTGEHSGHH